MNTLETPHTYGEVVAINVDIQNDFALPTGSLSVEDGEAVVPLANQINDYVRSQGGQVVFTQDWHPKETKHFAINHDHEEAGGPWPVHCVQNKAGAALHDDLEVRVVDSIGHKGMDLEENAYSGWDAELVAGTLTALVEHLPAEERTVGRAVGLLATYATQRREKLAIVVDGLATDYCDLATALDALNNTDRDTVDVFIVTDAMRAVDVSEGDGDRAIQAMLDAKAIAITTQELINGGIVIDRTRLEY